MAFCAQCGYQMRDGAAFCPRCGWRVPSNADAAFPGRPAAPAQAQPQAQAQTQAPLPTQPPAAQVAAVVNPALQALREAIVVMGGPGIAEVGEVAVKGETIISSWQGRF